jgi:hypothetical protein
LERFGILRNVDIMVNNSNPLEVAKAIASDIKDELIGNHLSTLTYNLPTAEEYSSGNGKIPIFVVVMKFNSEVATKLAGIAEKWKESRIEGPYIAEQNDFKGIEDSVPEELWNVMSSYAVLEGTDILKQLPRIDREYLRAQAEKAIRGYIFKLRWTLPQAITDKSELRNYMNNIAFYSQLTIQLYHKITHPDIRTIKGHLVTFSQEFPASWKYLKEILKLVYDSKPLEQEQVIELLINTINSVLVTILDKIDKMGK